MHVTLIAAMEVDNGIGMKNDIPWHHPEDLKWFKETTQGATVIMGRKTFLSIGKPLPNRTNIVLTTNPDYNPEGVLVAYNIHDAMRLATPINKPIFVMGGADIYRLFMPYASELLITHLHQSVPCDTFFPHIDLNVWKSKCVKWFTGASVWSYRQR